MPRIITIIFGRKTKTIAPVQEWLFLCFIDSNYGRGLVWCCCVAYFIIVFISLFNPEWTLALRSPDGSSVNESVWGIPKGDLVDSIAFEHRPTNSTNFTAETPLVWKRFEWDSLKEYTIQLVSLWRFTVLLLPVAFHGFTRPLEEFVSIEGIPSLNSIQSLPKRPMSTLYETVHPKIVNYCLDLTAKEGKKPTKLNN